MIQTFLIALLIFVLATDAFFEHGSSAWRRLFPKRDTSEKLEPSLERRFSVFRSLNMIAGIVGMVATILVMVWLLVVSPSINVPIWISIFFLIVAIFGASRLFRKDKIEADAQAAKELNLSWFTLSVISYRRIINAVGIGFLLVGFAILIALIF